jgi:mono/diheme cytochrome c family protein
VIALRAGWAAALAVAGLGAWAADKPVDAQTGLKIDQGFEIVKQYCTACHSARLITQAGKTRAGWLDSIRWMQQTQGLWSLEPYENEILDYLSRNYGVPPAATPMRPPVMPLPPAR